MSFKMALIQMVVEGGNKQGNLQRAENLIAEAAANGAVLVLLPEVMDLGWTDPSCKIEAEPIPGGMPYQKLADAAAKHGIFVCAGLTERCADRVFNSAVLIDRHGILLCKHRKLNELRIGHEYYAQGDRLNIAETELGTIGLMICADGFAKDRVLSRALCYMGADVILSPSAWAVDADHDNASTPYGETWRNAFIPVAKEFAVWIAGVSNVGIISAGPWAGRKCIGCSLVVDSTGREVVQGPYGVKAETILYVDIVPQERPARGCDWNEYWEKQAANQGIQPTSRNI